MKKSKILAILISALFTIHLPTAASASCAKIKSAQGLNCQDLKVDFDFSSCSETQKGSTEVKCKGDIATATASTENSIYTAEFQLTEIWGKAQLSQIGEIKKSAVLQLIPKKEIPKKNPEKKLETETQAKPSKPTSELPPDLPLSISGTFDGFYSFNFNRPGVVTQPAIGATAGNSSYRAYDSYHNAFGLNLAEITFKKASGEFSFTADLDFGQQVEQNHPGSGSLTLTDPETGAATTYENVAKVDEVSKHLGQASLTYTPRWGDGLTITIGKIYTHLGYEVAKAKDNWQYSRSYTYWYAMPVWHLGMALTYPVYEDKIFASIFIYNGWNNLYENNAGKTLGAQLKVIPNSELTFIYNIIGGPEKSKNNSAWKIVNEANAVWTATPRLSFALEGLVGYEVDSAPSGSDAAKWFGTSLHSKYIANDWYWISPRFEYYRDHNGYTLATNNPEDIFSFTITNAFPLGSGFELRAEGRVDSSKNTEIFATNDGSFSQHQWTGTLAVLFSF